MKEIIFCNVSEGTHLCNITKQAETAIAAKYLLGKLSGTAGIAVNGAADAPIGVITDEGAQGDDVNVSLLGCAETLKMIAAGNIAVGNILVPAADGKVQALSTTSGTYNKIGIAMNTAAANGVVEVLSCVPQQVVVAA